MEESASTLSETIQSRPTALPASRKRTARPDRIGAERNLEKWPAIWQPARANTKLEARYFEREIQLVDGRHVKAQVKVGFTDEGMLTTEDQKTYYALVKHWYESDSPETHAPFSIRKLAKLLQKKGWGTNVIDSITQSLSRLRVTPFTWTNSYHDASTGEIVEEIDRFNILADLKIVRRKVDGHITHEAGWYSFNDFITKNLLARHTKPVLFDTILQFKSDLAQLLYSHLDLMLFGKLQFERRTEELFNDLGLTGGAYKNRSNRRQKLERALKELRGVRLTSGWISEARIERTKDEKDFKIVIKKSATHQELPAEQSHKLHDELVPVRDEMATAATNLVQHFHRLFHNVDNHLPQSKEMAQAISLIATYGVDQARYVIDFSRKAAEETQYRPQTFGGILQYASRAATQFDQACRAQERARIARGRQALEAAYEKYKDEVITRHIEAFPEGAYDNLVEVRKQEMVQKGSFFEAYRDRPMFEDMVKGSVRAELRKTLTFVSFDQFCLSQASRILEEYGIEPVELGIESPSRPIIVVSREASELQSASSQADIEIAA
jgi:hypothetical protein